MRHASILLFIDRWERHASPSRAVPYAFGLSSEFLKEWTGNGDVTTLTAEDAYGLIEKRVFLPYNLHKIESAWVVDLLLDCIMDHGPRLAIQMAQQAAHVFPSGHMEAADVEAINRMTPRAMCRNLLAARIMSYGEIMRGLLPACPPMDERFNRLAEILCGVP